MLIKNPIYIDKYNGDAVKDVKPSVASEIDFKKLNLVFPYALLFWV